jgi:hypothetical protein
MEVFGLGCFEKGTSATCEGIAHVRDSETSISTSLDALRCVLLRQLCFKIITGCEWSERGVPYTDQRFTESVSQVG